MQCDRPGARAASASIDIYSSTIVSFYVIFPRGNNFSLDYRISEHSNYTPWNQARNRRIEDSFPKQENSRCADNKPFKQFNLFNKPRDASRYPSFLERIMTPILERPITLTARVVFGSLLLCQMALAVRHNSTHVVNVLISIIRWVFSGIVLEDVHNFAATVGEFDVTR